MPDSITISTAQRPTMLAGRFRLVERLGAWGIGVHWRAYDMELRETVTIKLLRDELAADDRTRSRLRREVKRARRVTHRNVVRIHGFGCDAGRCFVTLEALASERLDAILRWSGPMPTPLVYQLGVGLCDGLAAVHRVNVVHGDIRPQTLLYAPGRGLVLTDFGDELAGVPSPYLAPERHDGEIATREADVYSAGATLHALLVGRAAAADRGALSQRLPRSWVELLDACLSHDPRRRPRDGASLLAALVAIGR